MSLLLMLNQAAAGPAANPGGGVAMAFLPVKYATAVTIPFSIGKAGSDDLAVSADWTPAAGDTKISIDGGNDANTTNVPAAPASTAGKWTLTLTTGETTGKLIHITIIDSATKAVIDDSLTLFTYGHASAYWPFDLSTAMSGQAVGSVAGNVDGSVGSVTVVSDKTGYSLSNPGGLKKNTALANFPFGMRDATTGLLRSGVTVTAQRRIDNGAYAACANAVSEIGGTGTYTIDLAAADLNGDTIILLFTGSGCRETEIPIVTEP